MNGAGRAAPRSGAINSDLVLGAAALAMCAALVLTPSAVQSGPVVCPFRLLTGHECPACGSVRAWTAALHGDLGAAAAYNPFAVLTLGAAAALLAWRGVSLVARGRVRAPDLERVARSPLTLGVLAVWLVWWITGFVA